MFGLFGKSEAEIQELIDNKQYDELPTEVIDQLVKDLIVGANAIIAIDLDYSEISGDGKSMLFMVASGTACRVSPA